MSEREPNTTEDPRADAPGDEHDDHGSSLPHDEARQDAPGFDAESFLKTLTQRPGVYAMSDRFGRVIYVGKARNLKNRVSSYFRGPAQLPVKTRAMMSHMHHIDVTITHTETEALLLENNLIKEHRPRYNIVLRDDKSFPYIHVSTDQRFPRFSFYRGARNRKGRFFGPYASAGATRETLTQLQKLFRVRQCQDSFFNNRSRPCLQYQIRRCTAPCVEHVNEDEYAEDVRHALMFLEGKSEEMVGELIGRMENASRSLAFEQAARYRDQIKALRRVQERQYVSGARGDLDVVAASCSDGIGVVQIMVIRNGQSLGSRSITPRHTAGSDRVELISAFLPQYYLARRGSKDVPGEILIADPIEDAEILAMALSEQAGKRVSIRHSVRGERARWLQMAQQNADIAVGQQAADRANVQTRLRALSEALDLDDPPERIECFDISHSSGEATVASCVVFDGQGPVKSDYRRFNIRSAAAGDDYAAMREALTRRYTRLKEEEARLPELLLIDGGKGQLAQAMEVMAELQLEDIALLGVAKGTTRKPGLETLHRPGRATALELGADSPALLLIQQIRDEAHRFAITGHRGRRAKARKVSTLEEIPGVGVKLRQRLLREFGGLQGVSRAGIEDLARVQGISAGLARNIYDAFRGNE
ncbi:MAG: excinuclease ABC subunit UvrC [Gammaproteobacteria bacterium]|nr:excinuclease ABC subunit UvrC [Gammaproteobacteria bacterium]